MLEGRTEEIILLAKAVHKERMAEGREDDGLADYYAAETLLIQETFQRQLGCTISLLSAQRVRHATCGDSFNYERQGWWHWCLYNPAHPPSLSSIPFGRSDAWVGLGSYFTCDSVKVHTQNVGL